MTHKYTFDGQVKDNRLRIYDEQAMKNTYQYFEGCPVWVTIEKARNKRSNPQNAYLWGVCYKLISDFTGYEIDEVHEICKAKFLPSERELVNKDTGEIEKVTIGASTRKLTTVEFCEYIEKIQRFFAQLGCQIPDPNEVPMGAE
jgi:hypothetical protein